MRLLCIFAVVILLLGTARPGLAAVDPVARAAEVVAGQLLRALETRDFATAAGMFGGPLASMLPADKLGGIWSDLVERMGTLDVRAEPTASELGGGNVLVTQRLGFARGPLDMKTTVESATGRVVGLYFSPASSVAKPPPPDAPFTESPIRIGEGQGALDGLLTLPRGDGPFPCVVLVHGSGPHDRDETIGPNRPFRDIAWGLAERGIASVRYDKRTRAHAGAMASVLSSLTLEQETVRDAVVAVATARGIGTIDRDRVLVAGHSLGGTALPRIAERTRGLGGLVFLAASAEPLEDAIVRQSEYIAGLTGGIDEGERLAIEAVRAQANLVKSADLSPGTPSDLLPLGVPAAYWLDLRQHDPAKAAATLPLPMLFVQGGRDYQVTLADLDRFRRALRGRRDVRFAVFPALNHLFMSGAGPSRPEDYLVEGRVDAGVLDAITSFVNSLSGS